jgi:hypothetical protein
MPDQLLTCYIENEPLVDNINKQWEWREVTVVWIEVEIWVISKGASEMEGRNSGRMMGKKLWGLLVFGAFVFIGNIIPLL